MLGVSLGARHESDHVGRARADDDRRGDHQPAAPTATPEPDAVDELSLQEQVGKLVVLRFNGTTAPAYVRDVLQNGLGVRGDPVQGQHHRPRSSSSG